MPGGGYWVSSRGRRLRLDEMCRLQGSLAVSERSILRTQMAINAIIMTLSSIIFVANLDASIDKLL